jgi:hypothetical protein
MIDVSFEHWRYTFTEEMLTKYGSRYFTRNDAGANYYGDIIHRAEQVSSLNLNFSERQIRLGNEAFAESAVADPIADLEVWDEWRSGTRYFPYRGIFSRLGITRQDDKTSSPSSVGVIGEIMAGFFAQAGVSPWLLVRVVRRWPDFIFADRRSTYSFVESKAFTGTPPGRHGLAGRVLDGLLVEAAVDAAQQLSSDPFGRVWNSFTQISSIIPMRFQVTFFEFNVPDARRISQPLRTVPAAVAEGFAERAVNTAVARLGLSENDTRLTDPIRRKGELLPALRSLTQKEVDILLREIDTEAPIPDGRRLVEEAVATFLDRLEKRKWKPPKSGNLSGRRLTEAKQEAVLGRLSPIRVSGEEIIYIADLADEEILRIRRAWAPDWSQASLPCGKINGVDMWRCGGAVFCLGDRKQEGWDIRSQGLPQNLGSDRK